MNKRGHGEKCTYCKRTLESVTSFSRVAATKDHVVPKSKGGRTTVWACRQCNALKKDMDPDDWQAFMESYPEWWKNSLFAGVGKKHRQETFYAPGTAKAIPHEDSMYILKHGKKAWREKKLQEARAAMPAAIPLEYDDPKKQAAFEAVYDHRLHMLRVQPTTDP